MNLPQPDSGPDSNINSTYYSGAWTVEHFLFYPKQDSDNILQSGQSATVYSNIIQTETKIQTLPAKAGILSLTRPFGIIKSNNVN
jgi:hypothetical protein